MPKEPSNRLFLSGTRSKPLTGRATWCLRLSPGRLSHAKGLPNRGVFGTPHESRLQGKDKARNRVVRALRCGLFRAVFSYEAIAPRTNYRKAIIAPFGRFVKGVSQFFRNRQKGLWKRWNKTPFWNTSKHSSCYKNCVADTPTG